MTPSPPPNDTPRRNITGAVAPALAAAALAGLGAMYLVAQQRPAVSAATPPSGCILEHADAIGGPISLVDTTGATLTQADFAGQPAVIYFGFTHCPDVCPTTMYVLNEALQLPDGYDVQPILISVDPARDTPQAMARYVATDGYPEGLIGLTGSQAQVDAATRAFHVSASRGEDTSSGYNVNHSTFLYVVDENWRTVAAMPTFELAEAEPGTVAPLAPVEAEEVAACIVAGLDRRAAQP
jgi:protein SCO1/2